MADPIWRLNFEKCSELDEIVRIQVFGVAESKSTIRFSKFKMADPIWQTEIQKIREKVYGIVHCYVFRSLNPNPLSDFQYLRLRIQYGIENG